MSEKSPGAGGGSEITVHRPPGPYQMHRTAGKLVVELHLSVKLLSKTKSLMLLEMGGFCGVLIVSFNGCF